MWYLEIKSALSGQYISQLSLFLKERRVEFDKYFY
nr:MAG TPA: hypothetical protein [Caudoviricetes sp.]